jgi:hypothetical protein
MQPGERIRYTKHSTRKQSVKTHHLSTFGILNRNGLEITNGRDLPDLPVIEEEIESTLSEFSDWSMPEQRVGYIQCKLHDFL